jgi:hypothetical protein
LSNLVIFVWHIKKLQPEVFSGYLNLVIRRHSPF